jgi:mannose-6-phosphate isomerase-like protein (cupin superfamily)
MAREDRSAGQGRVPSARSAWLRAFERAALVSAACWCGKNEKVEYFPIDEVRARLEAEDGGWEVVHESPNLEVGVLTRIAPTPDPPVRHTADEVYVVLAGEATLEAEGDSRRLKPGDAAFVAVGKEHHFVDYERISVLVVFAHGG